MSGLVVEGPVDYMDSKLYQRVLDHVAKEYAPVNFLMCQPGYGVGLLSVIYGSFRKLPVVKINGSPSLKSVELTTPLLVFADAGQVDVAESRGEVFMFDIKSRKFARIVNNDGKLTYLDQRYF